ncbi:MAG: C1 family peptidase [Terriglobia bacterium]
MKERRPVSSLATTCAVLIFLAWPAWGGQREDYAERERKAPPGIQKKLEDLRAQVKSKKLKFSVGYTKAMDYSLEQLAGARPPKDLPEQARKQNALARELLKLDRGERDKFAKGKPGALPELNLSAPDPASLASFDWRMRGKVTPVRDQGACGSCWAFGTVGTYEGSYRIRNNVDVDGSEQYIVTCSLDALGARVGSCAGGWWAFDHLINQGDATETDLPYTATDGSSTMCATNTPYRGIAWGYVSSEGGLPTVAEMKTALCTYGPLAVTVRVTSLFQAYTEGVFDERDPGPINHAIVLIGWDDAKGAWLIKNSWGTSWGETGGYGTDRGFMWIAYESNGIGTGAAWVQALSEFYSASPDLQKLLPRAKPMPAPRKR